MRSLCLAILLTLQSVALFAATPQSASTSTEDPLGWIYKSSKDAITNEVRDTFALTGKFLGEGPGFPYRDAIPMIIVGCSKSEWKFTAINFGVLLDPGFWPIKNRIDDVQGEFTRSVLGVKSDNAVYITKSDFGKIMRAEKVIIRMSTYKDGLLDAEFDLSVDFSKVKEKCPK